MQRFWYINPKHVKNVIKMKTDYDKMLPVHRNLDFKKNDPTIMLLFPLFYPKVDSENIIYVHVTSIVF